MSGLTYGPSLQPTLETRLEQVLSPRMIQAMAILQLPVADLRSAIEKELQENPFLEQTEPGADRGPRPSRAAAQEASDRKLDALANVADRPQSLQDFLSEQLGEMELTEGERRLAEHICSFMDCTGYLGTRERDDGNGDTFRVVPAAEIAATYDRPVTEEDVEDVLIHVVQRLEPGGGRCP